jgi:hypothetical protein
MKRKKVNIMGMKLIEWTHKSCIAHFGIGKNWATLYDIMSKKKGKGHATELLTKAKQYYESKGKRFGGSVALNDEMRRIYIKLGIKEYDY